VILIVDGNIFDITGSVQQREIFPFSPHVLSGSFTADFGAGRCEIDRATK